MDTVNNISVFSVKRPTVLAGTANLGAFRPLTKPYPTLLVYSAKWTTPRNGGDLVGTRCRLELFDGPRGVTLFGYLLELQFCGDATLFEIKD